MFTDENFNYRYAPILSLRPSEINALQELTDKAKNLILPIILLRGWVGSKKLENSIPRIQKAFGNRYFVLDIDPSFLSSKQNASSDRQLHDVFREVEALLSPAKGYDNWYNYLRATPKAIPTLQLGDLSQLDSQIDKLSSLGRGLVVKFDAVKTLTHAQSVFQSLVKKNIQDLFIVFDYGQVKPDVLTNSARIIGHIQHAHTALPTSLIAISCSSFPSSFPETSNGENSIYERMLFNVVHGQLPDVRMIYSDTASARAEKLAGGGIPSPRIDYPLREQWRFIKKTYSNSKEPDDDERIELYTEVAQEIMDAEYWEPDLHVWGTQMIELTSKGEGAGIDNATKATAVRINLHMHQQIYYNDNGDLLDTEEDWVD